MLSWEARNYSAFLKTPFTLFALSLIVYMVYRGVKENRLSFDDNIRILFPFLLTGLVPVAWYAFATNHSTVHCFFTNKAAAVSLLAVLFRLICLLRADKAEAGSAE